MTLEDRATKVKRLRMRSMRRGIKEMDVILSAYADQHLAALSDEAMATYDALLSENDHDIYSWVTGQGTAPAQYQEIMADVTAMASGLTRPQ
ncbi:MAG: succinate dehydrogenase assembly factor 2 [Pseudomonadota bacterium]